MTRSLTLIAGAALWAVPLALVLLAAVFAMLSPQAWALLWNHPQLGGGTGLALWTGSAALIGALLLAVTIIVATHGAKLWPRIPLLCGLGLAIPHLAFAIGFGFLIMPSGLAARVMVGGAMPPAWETTQDTFGLTLIMVLILKETPFLVLVLWNALAQGQHTRVFDGQIRIARSLGHGLRSVWLRVLLPQLLRTSLWPILIVWVYGVTTVDVALVAGPAQPPTLAVLLWTQLNDVDALVNRSGVAGSVAFTVLLVLIAVTLSWSLQRAHPVIRRRLTQGPSPARLPRAPGLLVSLLIAVLYVSVVAVLLMMSLAPRWPYPDLLPPVWSIAAWSSVSLAPLVTSLWLALSTSLASLALIILWFETVQQRFDNTVLIIAVIALGLPAITIAAGQYQLFLHLGLTATAPGLFLVHLTPVLAYTFIVLRGPYRAVDPRYAAVGRSLGAAPFRLWVKIKLPLLRAPVAMALAVGVSVSLVQFVPAQLIAAGRFSTLPMDAVTLASGGNRALTAAHALMLAVPALAAFTVAAVAARPRWR